ncbi:MAG TPA: glycosyltransferase family 87 protein, partial [Candidatus Dormibacteraeota bacterium]|nr:glycosyltransferase family 87 protein [Candidatus Dormibacteraeota bacterium]
MAARIGLEHGWSHIYSLPLQHHAFSQLRPTAPWHSGGWFLATPPYAWLLAPFVPFGAKFAVAFWMAAALVSLAGAWWIAAPGSGWTRALWLLGALAWYPVLYALSLVQPDFVVVLIVAAAWKLAEKRRPYVAGVVLGLTAVKPQLVLLLPLVLLSAGRWRIVASWAAVAGALALLSLLSLGADGFADYRSILSQAQAIPNNRYFTPAYLLGAGAAGYAFSAAVIVAAAIAG